MAVLSIALLVLVFVVPVFLYEHHRAATVKWFNRILKARRLIFSVFTLLVAITLFLSGIGYLMVIGAVVLAGVWLFVLTQTDLDVPDPRRYL